MPGIFNLTLTLILAVTGSWNPWASLWWYSLPMMPMASLHTVCPCLLPPKKTSVQWHLLTSKWRKKAQRAGIFACYVQGHLSATWQLNVYWLARVPGWRLNCLPLFLATSYWVPTMCSLPCARRRSFLVFKQLSGEKINNKQQATWLGLILTEIDLLLCFSNRCLSFSGFPQKGTKPRKKWIYKGFYNVPSCFVCS